MVEIKEEVAAHWNRQSCGSGVASASKFTLEYFEQIESFRYAIEPEIHAFAQFTRHRGQRLLEVGVGAGSDFLQWVRAGTIAHGVDLTQEAVDHVKHRLEVYGLQAADVRVGDAENLPYPDASFDITYSWGVIHHSPDTPRALAEIVRVTRPGGTIKLMVYHRRSLHTFYWWVRYALLCGRPWRSFADVLYHHHESIGTKAYTTSEFRSLARRHSLTVELLDVQASPFYDLLSTRSFPERAVAYLLASVLGHHRCGWYMRLHLKKAG